jgi:four helix bundle protein
MKMNNNVIKDKSKAFAIRVIQMCQYLQNDKKEFVMSKQVLKSGTSIGANVREALRGQSTPDFYAKLSISLKEAEETCYWLELLHDTDYLSDEMFQSMYSDAEELLKLLVSITKTIRNQIK